MQEFFFSTHSNPLPHISCLCVYCWTKRLSIQYMWCIIQHIVKKIFIKCSNGMTKEWEKLVWQSMEIFCVKLNVKICWKTLYELMRKMWSNSFVENFVEKLVGNVGGKIRLKEWVKNVVKNCVEKWLARLDLELKWTNLAGKLCWQIIWQLCGKIGWLI